jgi:amino acid transporter
MKPLVIIGLVLAVIGIAAFAYQGITYTTRESVVDIGPIHATADREKTFPISPMLAGVVVLAGVAMVVVGLRKRA